MGYYYIFFTSKESLLRADLKITKMFSSSRISNWLLVLRPVRVLVFCFLFCFVFLHFTLLPKIFLLLLKKILFPVNTGMILRRLDCRGHFWTESISFGRRSLYKFFRKILKLKIYNGIFLY